MIKKGIAASKWKTYLYGLFLPQQLCDAQYYADLTQFLTHKIKVE